MDVHRSVRLQPDLTAPCDGRFPVGIVLGERCRILDLLGRGGMGEVYRAHDLKLEQQVALKFLPEAAAFNPSLMERFRGEVRIARTPERARRVDRRFRDFFPRDSCVLRPRITACISGFGLINVGTAVAVGDYNEPMSGSEEMRPTPGVKLTYDDLLLFPDDGQRHELIDGEHCVTPSPNTAHQRIVGRLYLALGNYLGAHPLGELFLAPFDVVFSQFDVVEPDLLYITAERRHDILTTQHVRGTPDLVIEVGSPGTRRRDETIKRRLYERAGVVEYWFVDPELEVVRIYRRVGDGFPPAHELFRDVGNVLSSSLFPEFDLPLEEIFRTPA